MNKVIILKDQWIIVDISLTFKLVLRNHCSLHLLGCPVTRLNTSPQGPLSPLNIKETFKHGK